MKNTKYHIDVTPEEDALFRDVEQEELPKNSSRNFFNKTFLVVAFVHVALAAGITTYASSDNTGKSDQNFLKQTETISEKQPEPITQKAQPEPLAPPQTAPPQAKQPEQQRPVVDNLTNSYLVKQGDTIYSISKKYKLNTDKLLKLNNIKDPNKIVVGQTLKFL
jgi:LysM repeat protein